MQTLRKKTSPLKYRNEPARFFGDGVMFKAKLIGILEVGEARGDRMCQEALQDLKMAIRAAGEHKQRITIHVTIDGLRLRDEKTGDSLYHHPVHKISFIAQDMTDSRAFGYIFGSPDSGHRFFGIKTDKAASQVVLAMRDLFQVVFELKKKEIELARQHIQNKITSHEHQQVAMAVKNSILSASYKSGAGSNEASKIGGATAKAEKSPESVADLVDLEQELSSIQRGITQMERITPLSEGPPTTGNKNVLDGDDPFGDSFTNFPTILPPPETSKRHQKQQQQQQSQKVDDTIAELSSIITSSTPPIPFIDGPSGTASANSNERSWLNSPPITSVFEDSKYHEEVSAPQRQQSQEDKREGSQEKSQILDAFTDLDPLGTGKTKPYIDKKFFFQDLKNPPKKVLKDLSASGQDSVFDVTFFGENRINQDSSPIQPAHSSKAPNIISIESSLLSREEKVEDTRKDPFDDGEFARFSSDPFDALFAASAAASSKQQDTIVQQSQEENEKAKLEEKKSNDSGSGSTGSGVFNGPLQVSLPPEGWSGSYNSQKRLERQNSDGSSPASNSSTSRNRPNVFKQNTVDVISKKMKPPNLFGQKFTKRDSNGINMRRLQESDSLSETETAEPPMPPPRPDYSSHAEPPPLPPKKQFNDNFVIRPSSIPSSIVRETSTRYDYVSSKIKQQNENAPPLPLPSRKVGRTETSFPGPGRPKKSGDDDDYMTPIQGQDFPTILPPPQQKKDPKRGPRKSDTDPKNLDAPTPPVSAKPATEIPNISLSQLLTLEIDDLANKLNVPVSKLNAMTLLELNTYLSEYVDKSRQQQQLQQQIQKPQQSEISPSDSPVFKVNFDDSNNATFVAKFDDNFGQDDESNAQGFVANFDHFNSQPVAITTDKIRYYTPPPAASSVPPADKYAVFREIIDEELKQTDSFEEPVDTSLDFQKEVESEMTRLRSRPGSTTMETFSSSPLTLPATKIDTKITDAISHAKDRYAALRDIILVEDLFDKSAMLPSQASMPESNVSDDLTGDETQDHFGYENVQPSDFQQSSPTINICESEEKDENEDEVPELDDSKNQQNLLSTSNKDDFEIDEYMKKAISNLSLDSKERLSPAVNKSPAALSMTSPIPNNSIANKKSPIDNLLSDKPMPGFSDISTSPIPLSKSPIPHRLESPARQEASSKSPTQMPEIKEVTDFSENEDREKTATPPAVDKTSTNELEQWAVFDSVDPVNNADKKELSTTPTNKPPSVLSNPDPPKADGPDSPYSSDGKNEWKQKEFPNKRWPKGHTSSSSRDVSPWDEDAPHADYRRRAPHHAPHHPAPPPTDRYARPAPPVNRYHARRINSCDEDYEYEDEIMDRRTRNRISKGPMHRSKEILDSEQMGWYPSSEHHQWSPQDDDRSRSFDRNAYERSTYGPPYEKRGPYDRRDVKGYTDKRKFYRGGRNDYDYEYDPYLDRDREYEPPPPRGGKLRKEYDDYEGSFERGSRESRSAREYFYDRDRKSFDRDSNESYDSGRGRRSMGSGELYGSFEGRSGDYRGDRDRYVAQTRSLRRGPRPRSRNEEDQDSDNEMMAMQRRQLGSGETGSLQRVGPDKKPKSMQIPLDDEVWGTKSWKQRPASATEPERGRYPMDQRQRNISLQNPLSGSDGEKDKRFKKKPRSKGKEVELRSNYATIRYPQQQRRDYYDYEDDRSDPEEIENTSPRLAHDPEGYYSRRPHYKNTTPRSETRSFSESLKTTRYGFEDDDDDYDDPKSANGSRRAFKKSSSREMYLDDTKERFVAKFPSNQFEADDDTPIPPPANNKANPKGSRMEFNFTNYNQSQANSSTSNKFNFDDGNGFESDFNSPPKQPATTHQLQSQSQTQSQHLQPQQQKSFRFSNDFSDKESSSRQKATQSKQPQSYNFEVDFSNSANNTGNGNNDTTTSTTSQGSAGTANTPQQKLRFNENVSVSSFDADFSSQQMFEDDFSKSDLTFEAEDQWNPELPGTGGAVTGGSVPTIQSSMKKLNSTMKSRAQDIKKSESVNIFARKVDDPFEDDDFFASGGGQQQENGRKDKNGVQDPFQWNKNNFANFDDNI